MDDKGKSWITCRFCGNSTEGRTIYEDADILTVECGECGSIYKEDKTTGKNATDPLPSARPSADTKRRPFFINMQIPGFE